MVSTRGRYALRVMLDTPTELRQCRSQRSSTRHPYNVRPSAEEPVCFTICWLDWILALCR